MNSVYKGNNINIEEINDGFIVSDNDSNEAIIIDNVEDAVRLLQNLTCYVEHMGNTDEGGHDRTK